MRHIAVLLAVLPACGPAQEPSQTTSCEATSFTALPSSQPGRPAYRSTFPSSCASFVQTADGALVIDVQARAQAKSLARIAEIRLPGAPVEVLRIATLQTVLAASRRAGSRPGDVDANGVPDEGEAMVQAVALEPSLTNGAAHISLVVPAQASPWAAPLTSVEIRLETPSNIDGTQLPHASLVRVSAK